MKLFYFLIIFLLVLSLNVNGLAISPPKDFGVVEKNEFLEGEIIVIGTEDEQVMILSPESIKINPKNFGIKNDEIKTIDFSLKVPEKNGKITYNLSFQSQGSEEGIFIQKQILVPISMYVGEENFKTKISYLKLKIGQYKEESRKKLPIITFFLLLFVVVSIAVFRYVYNSKRYYY